MLRARLIFVLLLASLAHAADAPPVASLHATGFVNDFAHVIDASSKQAIESLCSQLDRKTASQISVVTIQTLGDADKREPIEDYANQLYRSWGIGRKDSKGALLLLVISDRKSRLEVGYGLEPLLPDGFDGSVLREMRPFLAQTQYGPAVLSGVRLLAQRVAEKSNVTLDMSGQPQLTRPGRRPTPSSSGAGTIVIIIIVILFLILTRGRGGPFVFLGGGFGGGGGRGGGGGDSGGFGGFGGGDSGGGGASSDW